MVLPVREFSAAGYRSLQRIHYPMSRLDVFVGANGVGKSNLYRGLELGRAAAANTLGEELAREGLDLAMWAGPRKKGRQLIKLAASSAEPKRLDTAYRYEVEVGFPPNPPPVGAPFPLAPEIKSEALIFRRRGGLKMLPLRGSCRAATEGVSAQELVWAGFICI